MKKLAVMFAAFVLFAAGGAAYAGPIGPPEPSAKEGRLALGFGYFFSSAEWEISNGHEGSVQIDQHRVFVQLNYGLAQNAEVYLRVGGADLRMKDALPLVPPRSFFDDNFKVFGAVGFRGVWNVTPSFGIGPFLQATVHSIYEDSETLMVAGIPVRSAIEFENPWEIKAGIGLQGKIGMTLLYAGAFVYSARAKVEARASALGVAAMQSFNAKDAGNYGGFTGIRLPLGKRFNLEVEGQLKRRFSMGSTLTYRF